MVALANCPQLTTPCAVYFIGIGGIGMSALARYYKHEGMFVAGYDRTPSPLTEALEREGIDIHYEDNINLISPEFLPDNNKYSTNDILVIYTPAVPESHSEWQFFKQHGYQLIKRSAALGYIAAGKITLAVAGTHGKTTTTTLLAHVLKQTSNGCTAFLGGISKNYNSNLLLSASPALVAEADEFDRSFLQLFPHVAVITATDADHLDIYGTHKAVKDAFSAFAAQVKPNGVLILKQGVELPLSGEWESDAHTVYRYALREKCDFYASDIRRLDSGLTQFDIHLPDGVINDCVLGIPGLINVENAIAAVAAAWAYERLTGNDKKITGKGSSLKDALASFAGVQRRFDVQVNTPACTYIDDYAHHPEELRAAITSLREIYPERKITGVFQPHLYTRTRDFAEGFAASLDLLDRLILLDIYPARELPINGVSSQIIFDKMTLENKVLCHKNDLMNLLEKEPLDVLITFGAGDIDRFVPSITELLNRRYNDAR
ncbi:MAG: UDP-N-acetylmuramate--L-alanine ligase [Prevotellaceae bacterium]|nr:UDP-N-acetylmuramate--L-alanine ligase [Prevotellaceae bacterium]